MAAIPVKVYIRVRPISGKELREGDKDCVECYADNEIALNAKSFTFDRVFNAQISQDEVYDSCAAPLVESLFKGFNCAILAYGQTGSGKTFTMGTEETTDSISCSSRGIIPRMVESVFKRIASSADPDLFSVTVSMVEVYDEKVYDLLGKERAESLEIRESSRGVYVKDLSHNPVKSLTDTMSYLEKGCGLRKKGSTAMNEQSSRSHAVFTVIIEKSEGVGEEEPPFESKLSLVDLAGSERLKKTMAEGERKKEGIRINEGLLALGHVISALSEEQKHIPYRNSSITRILQDSLGGNSYTVMIACASPASTNSEETLSTLRYAYRTKKIKNKPVVNVDPGTGALKQLKEENRSLKLEILRLKAGRGATPRIGEQAPDSADEDEPLLLEMEKKILELQQMCHRHIREKENLVSQQVHMEEMLEKLNSKFEAAKQRLENKENDVDVDIDKLKKKNRRKTLLCCEAENNESANLSIIQEDGESDEPEAVAQSIHPITSRKTLHEDNQLLRQLLSSKESAFEMEKSQLISQRDQYVEKLASAKSKFDKLLAKKENELTRMIAASDTSRKTLHEENETLRQLLSSKESAFEMEKSQLISQRDQYVEKLASHKSKFNKLLAEKENEFSRMIAASDTSQKTLHEDNQSLRQLLSRKESAFEIEKSQLISQRDQYAEEMASATSHNNHSQKIKYVEKLRARINELETENASFRSGTVSSQPRSARTSSRIRTINK